MPADYWRDGGEGLGIIDHLYRTRLRRLPVVDHVFQEQLKRIPAQHVR